MNNIWVIAQNELSSSLRNKWVLFYPLSYFLIGLSLTQFSVLGVGNFGLQAVGRITSAIINFTLYFVTLVSLVLGGLCIVGDRESGALEWLCSQPISKTELLLGRFVGLLGSVTTTTLLGLGLAGWTLLLFFPASSLLKYALFAPVTIVLAATFLAIGLLVSVTSRNRLAAVGVVFAIWMITIFVYDLAVIYLTVSLSLDDQTVLGLALINPSEASRILMLHLADPSLTILGASGINSARELGALLPAAALGVLACYALVSIFLAKLISNRHDFV